jgi:hypothetical protein
MSHRKGYAKKKLYDGVRALVGAGDLESRLTKAAGFLIHIEDGDIPDQHRPEFTILKSSLFEAPSLHQSPFELRQISHDASQMIAIRLLDIL